MIPLTPDPDDMPRSMPSEHCCFCGRPTRMWYAPRDVAVCTGCAETREPAEVPTKDEWWDSPQAQGIAPAPTTAAAVGMIEVAKLEYRNARVTWTVAADGTTATIRSVTLDPTGTETLVEEERTDDVGAGSYSLFHDACTNALRAYTGDE